MEKMKAILGYFWAIAAFAVVLATFFGNSYFSQKLVAGTGVTISPRFLGGEILRTIDHGEYKTHIHRPVFDGLVSERKAGFIQINWEPFEGLPAVLEEAVSFSEGGDPDFVITFDTASGKASMKSYNASVVAVDRIYKLKTGWALRVALQK